MHFLCIGKYLEYLVVQDIFLRYEALKNRLEKNLYWKVDKKYDWLDAGAEKI